MVGEGYDEVEDRFIDELAEAMGRSGEVAVIRVAVDGEIPERDLQVLVDETEDTAIELFGPQHVATDGLTRGL